MHKAKRTPRQISLLPSVWSCLKIDLGRETNGNNEICLGVRFALCIIKTLRLARIEHCSGTVVTPFLPSEIAPTPRSWALSSTPRSLAEWNFPDKQFPGQPLENDDAEKTTDFIRRTRRRVRFFTKGTSSEERVGFQFVFSAFVFVFCLFVLFYFPLFMSFFSFFFFFSISLSVACLPASFLLAHTQGILPDPPHTKRCTLLFFLLLL